MTNEIARTIIQELKLALSVYDAAADKFIKKVESGRAQSTETYQELKAARELSRKMS